MKNLIHASLFSILPLFIIAVLNCVFVVIYLDGNLNMFIIIGMAIEIVSISIIMTTIILLQSYANKINDLDKAQNELYEKNRQLNTLIAKYNEHLTKI